MTDATNRHRIAQVRARMAKARHQSARATALAAANQLHRIERLQAEFNMDSGATLGASLGAHAGFAARLETAAGSMAALHRSAAVKVEAAETIVHRTERALTMTADALHAEQKKHARRVVPRLLRKEDE